MERASEVPLVIFYPFCFVLFAHCSLDQKSIYIIGFEAPRGTEILGQSVWIWICLQRYKECWTFEGKWNFLWNCETDDKVCKGWVQSREDTCQVLLQTCLQSAKWCRLPLSRISRMSRMSQIFWILCYINMFTILQMVVQITLMGVTISLSHVWRRLNYHHHHRCQQCDWERDIKEGAQEKALDFPWQ